MEENDYRQRLLAEVEAARAEMDRELAQAAGTAAPAVRRSEAAPAPTLAGIEAADGGRPDLRRAAQQAWEATAFDRRASADARTSALDGLARAITDDGTLPTRLIRLLTDPKEEAAVRLAAFRVLKVGTFASRTYPEWRPGFLTALRSVAKEPPGPLVSAALEALVQEKDGWALSRLEEGLRNPKAAPVQPLEALRLLAYDDHGGHFDVVREIAVRGGDAEREAAVRLLAADPSAGGLLGGLVQNAREKPGLRQAALLALRAASPDDYRRASERILHDDGEHEAVRASAITAIQVDADTPSEGARAKLDQLAQSAPSAIVRAAARLHQDPE